MKNRSGMTLIELLAAIAVFALLATVVLPGLGPFFSRLEVHSALRAITSGLSAARYQAIRDNRPVRVEVSGVRLLLSRDDGLGWRVIRSFELGGRLAIRANSRPVFSPLGNVSPLCTISVLRERRVWRVVVSMYGRVKVYGGG